MTPLIRQKLMENVQQREVEKQAQQASVLLLFYPDLHNRVKFILILRKTYKGAHSGQIGLPGGKVEPFDKDLRQTALRETCEEIGVWQEDIEIVRPLTGLYIPVSNFWVHPYMGFTPATPQFKPQESEVAQILYITLEDLLDDSNIIQQNVSASYTSELEVPAFLLHRQTVWGATAMMLNEAKYLFKQVL